MSENKKESKIGRANGATNGGGVAAVKNAAEFVVRSNTSKSTVVAVFDKGLKSTKGKPLALMRFDKPHAGAPYNHINVHKSISAKIPNHTPISSGQLQAAQAAGKIAEVVNTVAKPLMVAAVVVDAARIGMSVKDDIDNKTTRNTVSTVATVAGGWGGGAGGAMAGAAIGSAIFPGLGTIFGGLIGGIAGGIGGSVGGGAVVDAISDEIQYDIEIVVCTECKTEFRCRVYVTGRKTVCPNCEDE